MQNFWLTRAIKLIIIMFIQSILLLNKNDIASVGWFGWIVSHINHCRLFNAKSSLYIYIRYIWFGLVGFCGISTTVGYLMPNPLYTYALNIYDLVLVGFYGISTTVGYLMPNPLCTYILDIYDLVWLSFMAYQTL